MRTFKDESGATWMASVREIPGDDYKGRFLFVMAPEEAVEGGGVKGEGVELVDVRWNSRRTAERTLKTMSELELARRHRSALGRAA